jgi:hypothetical protein
VYAHDGSLFLPAEAVSQLTQLRNMAAELLTCFDEELEWDIEHLFGLLRRVWSERSVTVQEQNSRASMKLTEEHFQSNEQCRAKLQQFIQRASEFRPKDLQIQPALTQTTFEELIFHLPKETTTGERPSLNTMLSSFVRAIRSSGWAKLLGT